MIEQTFIDVLAHVMKQQGNNSNSSLKVCADIGLAGPGLTSLASACHGSPQLAPACRGKSGQR